MNKYSEKSNQKLATCHPDIRKIFNKAIKIVDITVFYGIRTLQEQQQFYKDGKSKLDGVINKSKHQGKEVSPEIYQDDKDTGDYSYNNYGEPIISFAIDAGPHPLDFGNASKKKARFYYLNGVLQAVTYELLQKGEITHKLRWGGDWDGDGDYEDQSFDDLNHWELIEL